MYNGVCTTGAETIPQLHDKENPLEKTDVQLPPSPWFFHICPAWGKERCYRWVEAVVGILGAGVGLLQLHFSQKLLLPETTTSTATTAVARNAMGSSVTTSQSGGQQCCQNTHSLIHPLAQLL